MQEFGLDLVFGNTGTQSNGEVVIDMYMLNDNFIEIKHRPDFGWFDDDGSVFLRTASQDAYEARYGGYLEAYVVPSFHGVISGLAT